MPILTASSLKKAFRGEPVLRGVSLSLEDGRRYGLVGPNGGGKSTLARILAGELEADDGAVSIPKDLSLVYLPQRPALVAGRTVIEEVREAFADLAAMEARLEGLGHEMARTDLPPERVKAAVDRHGTLLAEFEARKGWDRERRAVASLTGLGVPEEFHGRDVATLSGGQATRVALARALLVDPDLLLLDEPTNHLDLDAIEWLEGAVVSRRGTTVVVSHDRWFLDRVASEILEIEGGRLHSYPGGYGKFERLRAERREREQKAFEKQREYIEKEEEFIRRNIAAQAVSMARGKRKRLERLERLEAPHREPGKMVIPASEPDRHGSDPLAVKDLVVRRGELDLLGGMSLRIARGSRVGVVGPNGAGKTTFLKVVTGEIMPSRGRVDRGAKLRVGHLTQEPECFTPGRTVLETMWTAMPDATRGEVRGYLARFLFREEEVEKDVAGLSGGEAARLALALLFLRQPNFLVLDEPTNHLDIPACEALEEALSEFPGTVLLVSHDRYLLEAVADRIVEIRPDGVTVTEGGWSDHLNRRDAVRIARAATRKKESAGAGNAARSDRDSAAKPGKLRNPFKFARLEEEIIETEERIAVVNEALADPAIFRDPERLRSLKEELPTLEARLAELYETWESWA